MIHCLPSGTPGAVSSTGTFDRDPSEEEGGKVGDHVDVVIRTVTYLGHYPLPRLVFLHVICCLSPLT